MMKMFAAALAGSLLAACGEAPPSPDSTPSPAPAPAAPSTPAAVAGVIPAAFHGEWTADLAACGTQNSDSRLRIGAAELTFYESGGEATRVIVNSANEVTVSASMNGEGETWTADYRFTLSEGGQTLSTALKGAPVMVRKRCP